MAPRGSYARWMAMWAVAWMVIVEIVRLGLAIHRVEIPVHRYGPLDAWVAIPMAIFWAWVFVANWRAK